MFNASRTRSSDRLLARPGPVGLDGNMPEPATQDVDRRMALAREWDELVEQVRGLDGFADFLRPPRLEALLPAAAQGPVVIINVSRWRCDALIVRTSGVQVVALPELTVESAAEQVSAYLRAVTAAEGEDGTATETLEPELERCLRWMWDAFAGAILEALGYHGPPPPGQAWPRVWWCPTGPLTLLPIHAAGRHDVGGAAVLDRVVSSYTPTLRALLEARAGRSPDERPDADPGRLLFVGVAEAEGLPRLPHVAKEEQALRELLPAGDHTFLTGSDAVRGAVLDQLVTHAWAHFSCHGHQNLDDPSRGGLLLHDGFATITDFSARQYRGELAYLSGCKTAVGGVNLPDEAITLAAALHYTGYRHVIATLWSVRDRLAARVAANVYAELVRDGRLDAGGAALALHNAVRKLRERHRGSPSVWTPFAHTGP